MSYAQPFEGYVVGRRNLFRKRKKVKPRLWRPRYGQRTFHPYPQRGLSGVTDFPQVQEAIDYTKSKVGEFLGLPTRFRRALEKVSRIKEAAIAKKDNVAIAKANALETGVNQLKAKYPALERKLTYVLDQLKAYGFGLLPLLLVGVVLTVAGAVAFQLTAIKKLELQIDAAEKGLKLPPTFSLLPTGGDLMGWLPLVAVGGLGLWFVMRRR